MLDKLYMLNCFKCSVKSEDVYEMCIICFICKKYFCITCYHKHHHNNTESHCEDLFDIIIKKNKENNELKMIV